MNNNILITGGCGFIGSHLIRQLLKKYQDYNIFNLDKLTYAGNRENLLDIEKYGNYLLLKEDICDFKIIKSIFSKYKITHVIHLAAESHVDRSIKDPFSFAKTNVMGTLNLLQAAKDYWKDDFENKLFYHISTDEVYGSLNKNQNNFFVETTRYDPHSPYAASKASSDHFVRAYFDTYRLPIIISNCSNNYGPNQFPEKLIPLIISKIIEKKPLPVYGNGENIRDWIHVKDHVNAIDIIFHKGKPGETYNVGASNEWRNIDLIKKIINITDRLLGQKPGFSNQLIKYVDDRKGHDYRYGIDSSKLRNKLGWEPNMNFEKGLENTIKWYINSSR